jgi:hypothetical protein
MGAERGIGRGAPRERVRAPWIAVGGSGFATASRHALSSPAVAYNTPEAPPSRLMEAPVT